MRVLNERVEFLIGRPDEEKWVHIVSQMEVRNRKVCARLVTLEELERQKSS